MRATSIRLDDYLDNGEPVEEGKPIPTLSMGEDAENQALNDNYHEVITDLGDTKRLVDMHAALEELQLIAERITETTPREALLVDTAVRAAVAGTDIQSTEVLPGLENFVGTRMSLEGLGSFIKSIWDAIAGFIKKIWAGIAGFFTKLAGKSARTERKAATLLKQAEAKITAKPKQSTVTLGSGIRYLSFGGKFPTSTNDIHGHLKSSRDVMDDLTKFTGAMAAIGTMLANAITQFDEQNPEQSIQRVLDVVKGATINHEGLTLTAVTGDQRYSGGVFGGYEMMGNMRVLAKLPLTASGSGDTDSDKITAAKGTDYDLAEIREGLREPDSASIRAPSGSELAKLAKECEDLANQVKGAVLFNEKASMTHSTKAAVTKAGEHLTARLSAIEAELSPAARSGYKDVVRMAATYEQWVSKLPMRVLRHLEQINSAVIDVISRSLDNLE